MYITAEEKWNFEYTHSFDLWLIPVAVTEIEQRSYYTLSFLCRKIQLNAAANKKCNLLFSCLSCCWICWICWMDGFVKKTIVAIKFKTEKHYESHRTLNGIITEKQNMSKYYALCMHGIRYTVCRMQKA